MKITVETDRRTALRYVTAAIGVTAVGVGCIGAPLHIDATTIGTVLVLCAVVSRKPRDEEAIYDTGQKDGYERGFMDGRKLARPVVVPFNLVAGHADSSEWACRVPDGGTA